MVRVELKNFQSIADEVIEIEGFSAVTGRSNLGKSAIVRAIKAAITGAPVDCYVRHSEICPKATKGTKTCKCFCSVRIVGDGLDLLWEKGDGINRYVHNGVEHTVVGRGTPDFLGPGFGMINLGPREKTVLQVADQFHPLFILDKSGTVVADVLSDVAKLDQINVAIRLSEKDRKEAASTRRVREKDISDIKQGLTKYDGLDDTLSKVKAVEELGRRVEKAETATIRLSEYCDVLGVLVRAIKALSGVSTVVVPPVRGLETTQDRISDLRRLEKEYRDRQVAVDRLSGVPSIAIPSFDQFSGLAASFHNLTRWGVQVQSFKAFFAKAAQTSSVSIVEPPPIQEARDIYRKLDSWGRRLSQLSKDYAQSRNDLAEADAAESEVLAQFSELGVCPTCKQDVKVAAHQGAHA